MGGQQVQRIIYCSEFNDSKYLLIENGQMIVEFISYGAKPLATTGKGNEDSLLRQLFSKSLSARCIEETVIIDCGDHTA